MVVLKMLLGLPSFCFDLPGQSALVLPRTRKSKMADDNMAIGEDITKIAEKVIAGIESYLIRVCHIYLLLFLTIQLL